MKDQDSANDHFSGYEIGVLHSEIVEEEIGEVK